MAAPPAHHTTEHSIPDLSTNGANLHIWLISLTDFIDVHTFPDFLSATYTPPDPSSDDYTTYRQHRGLVRLAIMKSLPSAVSAKLEINSDSTPYEIVTSIKTIFSSSTAMDHHILRQQAEALRLTHDLSVSEYIAQHRTLRNKMKNAQYPEINDEATTVKFIAEGLPAHSRFKHLPTQWTENDNIPASVANIERRLEAIEARHKTFSKDEDYSTPQGLTQAKRRGQGRGGRGRGHRGGHRGRYYPNPQFPYQPPAPFEAHAGYHPPGFPYPGLAAPPYANPYPAYTQWPQAPYAAPPQPSGSSNKRRPPGRAPPRRATQANTAVEALEQLLIANDDSAFADNESTFILDSGAHPTHVPDPPKTCCPSRHPSPPKLPLTPNHPPRITARCSW